jgi:5-enolpyruvylshikimate-3-phosphate synthase
MTHGSDERPTRRVLRALDGTEYVVELRASLLTIRPKGTRRNGRAEVVVTPSSIYTRALIARAEAEQREKRRAKGTKVKVRRSLLG